MTQKTYNQYCPIAHSLDLIGERWTLLIIRDLFVGPRRFSDLARGLPGIGTNILTDRLKNLEEAGLIQTRYLPPPAASTVYELTERGQSLDGILNALTAWGDQSLGAPQPGQSVNPDSLVLRLRRLFKTEPLRSLPGTYAVSVRSPYFDGDFGVVVQGDQAAVEMQTPAARDLDLTVSLDTLRALSTSRITLREAIENGALQVDGPEARRSEFLARLA